MSAETLHGRHGAVSAGSALAANAAMAVLVDGGNAVDAAIAGSAVQCVVEMPWCGVGGDAFALVRSPSGELAALNGSGVAPHDVLSALGSQPSIPRFGAQSVAVPGVVDAWCELSERYGAIPLDELLAPACAYASDGFPLSGRLARALRSIATIEGGDQLSALVDGMDVVGGARFRQPDLGETLAVVAAAGRDGFYAGDVAKRIAEHVAQRGGALSTADLAVHTGEWAPVLQVPYRHARVSTQAPVSMGILLLVCLRVVEVLHPDRFHAGGAPEIDELVRLKHLVFSRVLPRLGDPRVVGEVNVLEDDTIADLAGRLRAGEAAKPVPMPGGSDTTSIAVTAPDGSAVTLIHSLFNEFGARELVPGTGIILNDRLANLAPERGAANDLAPGKRPVHTLHTYLVERADGTLVAGGTPGGRGQVQTNLQVLLGVLDGDDDLQEAVARPRWVSGLPRRARDDDTLYLEQGLRGAARELRHLGHRVEVVEAEASDHFGNCTVVARGADGSWHAAAADHRRAGHALVW